MTVTKKKLTFQSCIKLDIRILQNRFIALAYGYTCFARLPKVENILSDSDLTLDSFAKNRG